MATDRDLAAENVFQGLVARYQVEIADLHRIGDLFGYAQVDALQGKEHAQRDNEAGHPGAGHQEPVDKSDEQQQAQAHHHGGVDIQPPVRGHNAGSQARGADLHAGRQVERPANHQ